MINMHASQGHGSEVAWSLWAAILFDVKINISSAKKLGLMDDCVVALLALDAQSRGLIAGSVGFAKWRECMTTEHLYDRQWLLAYEANVKGWLPTVGSGDHVAADANFNHLKTNHVSFYDSSVVTTLRATRVRPVTAVAVTSEVSSVY